MRTSPMPAKFRSVRVVVITGSVTAAPVRVSETLRRL
ncbi:hypothetical protein ABLN85_14880, partial [Mycobacterium tuberculosis]